MDDAVTGTELDRQPTGGLQPEPSLEVEWTTSPGCSNRRRGPRQDRRRTRRPRGAACHRWGHRPTAEFSIARGTMRPWPARMTLTSSSVDREEARPVRCRAPRPAGTASRWGRRQARSTAPMKGWLAALLGQLAHRQPSVRAGAVDRLTDAGPYAVEVGLLCAAVIPRPQDDMWPRSPPRRGTPRSSSARARGRGRSTGSTPGWSTAGVT